MCRLFALRAQVPISPHEALCTDANALRVQSQKHPDGWGIGWYEGGKPRLTRGTASAFKDARFASASRGARSATVIAHVREASCGPIARENTHPFRHGRWIFCHNGTIARYPRVREKLEAEIAPDLRGRIEGDTDSERCFFLILTLLARSGGLENASLQAVVSALKGTIATVRRIADPGAKKPSSLNFLLTDGERLFASRSGRSLFVSAPKKGDGKRLMVASERILSSDRWREVPDHTILAVDEAFRVLRRRL